MGSHTHTYSTELMENYLQASTMAPDRLFQALQKPDGQTLLFSVGQNGSFNVIAEVAELAEDIDLERAQAALARAQDGGVTDDELPAVRRAETRIQVAGLAKGITAR